ncbi:MAG: aldo/keto reductase [Xenococcaceae cyanobacterium]
MQKVKLGSHGPTVNALGVGTWAWGDSLFWSYGKDYGAQQVLEAFQASIESGVTFFDTAEVYGLGESERLLGQFIKQLSPQAPVQVATKYFPFPWRWQQQAVGAALSASLERLQVDQVVLYQVHWPFELFLKQKNLMAALAAEVKRGRIQAVGVSNYSARQMKLTQQYLAEQGIPLAVNQVRYSLLNREIERNGVLEAACQLGVTILAYCPLAQGLLTGKYSPEKVNIPQGARRLDPRFSRKGLEKIAPLLTLLRRLGEKYQKTPAQVSLNWLIAQGGVMPIPGAKTAEQARQNAGALGWQLLPEDVEQLAQAS